MENKQNNKNSFLITWGSCIVFLLVLCFFGISDTMKGTRAAKTCERYACQDGGSLSGTKCTVTETKTVCTGGSSSSCSGSPSCCGSQTASCTYVPSSGVYNCTCTKSGSCKEEVVGTRTYNATCTKWSDDNSDDNDEDGDGTSNPSCVTKHPGIGYTCSYYYSGSTMCYDCTPKTKDDSNYDANSEEEALSECKKSNGKDCECVYLAENAGGTGAYYCRPKNYVGDKPVSGATYQCYLDKSTSKYIYGSFTGGNYHVVDDSKCGISTGDGANACKNTPGGGYLTPQTGKSCSYYYFGSDNSVCWYDCDDNKCAEGTHATTDEYGKVVCAPDCTCDETGCSDEEKEENSYCWNCNGTYSWGLESDNKGCTLTYINSKNSCSGSYSPTPVGPTPDNPNSGNPSNPTSSSKPSSSNNRGEGCYKNKDTGEFKWFESDPELKSNTKLYEKVNNSNCKQNVTENPQTGEIAMFLIWMIAFGTVGYSVWYYIKSRKEN